MTDNELRSLMSCDLQKGSEALYKQYSQYIYAIIFRILRDLQRRLQRLSADLKILTAAH